MFDLSPFLRLYARKRMRQLSRLDPATAQRRELLSLLRKAAGTRFGRSHAFGGIRSLEEYQERVPLRRYEDFWRDYWQSSFPALENVTWPGRIPYLAATSGTSSGRTKYIPVSKAMARANSRAGLDLFVYHVVNCPDSRVLGGKSFMLGGAVDLQDQGNGVMSGDLSGIARREVPFWSRRYIFPDLDLASESDWERKMERVGRASLHEPIRALAGTPSWLLLFFERLADMTGKRRLIDIYPELELVSYGGLNFAPYRQVFDEWLDGSGADRREVYPASEGFIAVADRKPGEGLRLILDNGMFFEFVPVDDLDQPTPRRRWVGDVEIGQDYALAVTTNAGLWSLLIGDVVRFVDLEPPRLMVAGRTSYFLSAFGEHLTGEEIESSVVGACESHDLQVSEFAVGARYPDSSTARGRHVFVVEFRDPQPDSRQLALLAADVDRRMCERNEDYQVHRQDSFGMAPPEFLAVEPGTFAEWMRSRGKLGGQNKVPRVINDGDLLGNLLAAAERRAISRVAAGDQSGG